MEVSEIGKVPNGSVLLMVIEYPGANRPFTYAAIKTGGLWYLTGSGQVPTAAGWGAVERWLGKLERKLISVAIVSQAIPIFPEVREARWMEIIGPASLHASVDTSAE